MILYNKVKKFQSGSGVPKHSEFLGFIKETAEQETDLGKHIEKMYYNPILNRYVFKEKDITYATEDTPKIVYKSKEIGGKRWNNRVIEKLRNGLFGERKKKITPASEYGL
jgi:hypothetical protein